MNRVEDNGNVLIVDDDSELRDGLCDVLVEEGYSARGATDGADALAHLRQPELPDVVLLDLRMPVMDGYEFLERRAADAKLQDIPVIVITSTPDPARLHFANVAMLSKPVDLMALLPLLRREVRRTSSAGHS